MNQIDLEGRRAVVTGGAQGIGLGIAERLADSGARVCLWDRNADALADAVSAFPSDAWAERIVVDVTDAEAIAEATAQSIHQLGGLDIFVNNAGIGGPAVPSWDYALDAWLEVIDVDLNAVFYCCRAILPTMMEQNYGRIVNVASIAGKEGNPNAAPYSAAKAGVIALTKSIAKETASYDIAINCVTPAVVKTRILEQVTEEHVNYMLSKIPRGRFLAVEEVSAMVAWLVSEENSFTTGAAFDLSGGRATY